MNKQDKNMASSNLVISTFKENLIQLEEETESLKERNQKNELTINE
jgi:hypothetical protein